jgi:hypothetical protein
MLTIVCQMALAEQQWFQVREGVCGKMLIKRNGKLEEAKRQKIDLYRPAAKDVPCCNGSTLLVSTQTSPSGKFLFESLDEGQYFIVLADSQPLLSVPVWVKKKYSISACDVDQRFTVDTDTGKSAVEVQVTID